MALVAAARLRAVGAAVLCSLALSVLAIAAFGLGYWKAFFAKIPTHVAEIEGWEGLMITVYGMARYWGAAEDTALLLHGVAAAEQARRRPLSTLPPIAPRSSGRRG